MRFGAYRCALNKLPIFIGKRLLRGLGSAGTRTRNQLRKLSGLLRQPMDCNIEIASRGFFFRFRVRSSLRASAIDGSSFATTSSIGPPNRCVV